MKDLITRRQDDKPLTALQAQRLLTFLGFPLELDGQWGKKSIQVLLAARNKYGQEAGLPTISSTKFTDKDMELWRQAMQYYANLTEKEQFEKIWALNEEESKGKKESFSWLSTETRPVGTRAPRPDGRGFLGTVVEVAPRGKGQKMRGLASLATVGWDKRSSLFEKCYYVICKKEASTIDGKLPGRNGFNSWDHGVISVGAAQFCYGSGDLSPVLARAKEVNEESFSRFMSPVNLTTNKYGKLVSLNDGYYWEDTGWLKSDFVAQALIDLFAEDWVLNVQFEFLGRRFEKTLRALSEFGFSTGHNRLVCMAADCEVNAGVGRLRKHLMQMKPSLDPDKDTRILAQKRLIYYGSLDAAGNRVPDNKRAISRVNDILNNPILEGGKIAGF